MNKENVWNNLLLLLEKEVEPHIFNNFLKDTKQLEIDDEKLVVEVASKFHKDYLNENISPKIKKLLNQLLGKDLNLLFSISKEKTLPKSNLNEVKKGEIDNIINIKREEANLNSNYTFNNFIVGASNQFAHAASVAVSKNPSKAYNPLFIYSGVGLGKTHLLNAIGNKVIENFSNLKVLYVSGEKFANDLINSIQNGNAEKFRNKYRKIDVLLVDDVHFIAGKPATQEEFFHTFNTLYNDGKQIVLTSDKPPKEIPQLEERLKSRFQSGLLVDIAPPDLETREAILRKKAESEKIEISPEVIHYIAQKIKYNIRELEGAFIKLVALSTLLKKEINLELAKRAVKDFVKENLKNGTNIETIQQAVADYYGIDRKLLISKRRISEILIPRQIAMYITREITNASLPEIGKAFGSKDHSTVLHSIEKIRNLRQMDENINKAIEKIMKDLSVENL